MVISWIMTVMVVVVEIMVMLIMAVVCYNRGHGGIMMTV